MTCYVIWGRRRCEIHTQKMGTHARAGWEQPCSSKGSLDILLITGDWCYYHSRLTRKDTLVLSQLWKSLDRNSGSLIDLMLQNTCAIAYRYDSSSVLSPAAIFILWPINMFVPNCIFLKRMHALDYYVRAIVNRQCFRCTARRRSLFSSLNLARTFKYALGLIPNKCF